MMYTSQRGWSLRLTGGWTPIDRLHTDPWKVHFVLPESRYSHLAWMVKVGKVDSDVLEAFDCITMMPGLVPRDEAAQFLEWLWFSVGELKSANVVRLQHGALALETIEEISADTGIGTVGLYQLVLPLDDSGDGAFQRFTFYAPLVEFEMRLAEVLQIVHSFMPGTEMLGSMSA